MNINSRYKLVNFLKQLFYLSYQLKCSKICGSTTECSGFCFTTGDNTCVLFSEFHLIMVIV